MVFPFGRLVHAFHVVAIGIPLGWVVRRLRLAIVAAVLLAQVFRLRPARNCGGVDHFTQQRLEGDRGVFGHNQTGAENQGRGQCDCGTFHVC